MTPMTTCFLLMGIIGFLQVADDWGVWIQLEKLYHKRNTK